MPSFFKTFFSRRTFRELEGRVAAVNALESEIAALNDEALKVESAKLREEIKKGMTLHEAAPKAFALAREAAKRTLGQRPFDVQLMGGFALHQGAIAEMATGEGKTLTAVLPSYLNALAGKGMHIVTVNEYLAKRDAVWMGQIYRALGLSVSCLGHENSAFLYDPLWHVPEETQTLIDKERDTTGSFLVQQEYLRPVSRREAYLADVTYGTNHEFGFDYLRDNLAYSIPMQVQRGHAFVIIDEADSILIDEARTPLIISAPDVQSSDLYRAFARIVVNLVKGEDYEVDEKQRSVLINDSGVEKVEKFIGINNMYAPEHLRLVHYLEESLKAKELHRRDKEYVVQNGEVIIVDEFTGRMLPGRRWSGGLHQAVEAKEGVTIKEESRTYAKISIQNYFRLYEKISGMTGTAQTSAEEFHKVYNLEVISIPTNRPMARQNLSDRIYKSVGAKWGAVANEVAERHAKGQPVLVGTTSIEKSEMLSALLAKRNIPHEVLNAKRHEEEGKIIAQAGKKGAVTVATNMAGRGVDIILSGNPPDIKEAEEIKSVGGLHVIGTDRHEARRIDNQLRGRAGRQGDPGSSQFFLSLEDDLLRIFGGEKVKSLMERMNVPDEQSIDSPVISKLVSQAQSRVEGIHFDLRKHLLDYDDVLNRQRTAFYKKRQELLGGISHEQIANAVVEASKKFLGNTNLQDATNTTNENVETLKKLFTEADIITKEAAFPEDADPEKLEMLLVKRSTEAAMDPSTLARLISMADMLWMNHLEDLEELHESVRLRAYGQKDPLVEYREESKHLFDSLWAHWSEWVFSNIFKLARIDADTPRTNAESSPRSSALDQRDSAAHKVGRNDPCPCGATHSDGRPMKYKHCHGKDIH